MSKEKIGVNKSTELFYDLACRSFSASWNLFMEVNGDGDANDYLDDPDFMSPFIIYVIDHIPDPSHHTVSHLHNDLNHLTRSCHS